METKQFELSNRLFVIAAILIGVLTLTYLTSVIVDFKNLPGNEPRYITVTGEGKAFIVPDIAVVSFGITKEGTDIPLLVTKTNEEMNAIIKGIKDLGVNEKDIRTTQYSLNPRYEYPEKTGERIFKGYEMDQTINVKIRDFKKIGDIYNIATSNGANVVGDLYFSVDNPEKVQQEARTKAIEQAKTKANSITNASGLRLSRLINVNDGYYPYYSATYEKAVGMGGSEVNSAPAPDIQPGQQEVDMTVTLTYRVY